MNYTLYSAFTSGVNPHKPNLISFPKFSFIQTQLILRMWCKQFIFIFAVLHTIIFYPRGEFIQLWQKWEQKTFVSFYLILWWPEYFSILSKQVYMYAFFSITFSGKWVNRNQKFKNHTTDTIWNRSYCSFFS